MKKIYIIFGPPGSGKGTQARRLCEEYGYFYFGTGELMRKEAEAGTPIGLEFKKVWDKGKGELVSEELVNKFVNQKITEIDFEKGAVFDGYPRTLEQAKYLESSIGDKEYDVLNLVVNPKSLAFRMSTRRICENCKKVFENPQKNDIKKCDECGGNLIQRVEDKSDVLLKRIEIYERETKPLIKYYKDKSRLINIDGEPTIEEVWSEIKKVLNG